jgi:signal transduction histidine kinase
MDSKNKIKILTYVIALFIGTAVISLFVYNDIKDFEQVIVKQNQQHLLNTAKSESIHFMRFITDVKDDLKMLALTPQIQNDLSHAHEHDRPLKNISTTEEYEAAKIMYDHFAGRISAIYAIDTKGMVKCRVPCIKEKQGTDYSEKPGVKAVIQNQQSYISELFQANSGQHAISVCVPVFEGEKFIGVLRAMIHTVTLSNCLNDSKIGQKGYVWMIDDNRIVISHPKKEHIGKDKMAPRKAAFPDYDWLELENIVSKMTSGESGACLYRSAWWLDEKPMLIRKLIAYAPVRIGNKLWSIGVSMGYDEISGPIKAYSRNLSLKAGFIILLFTCAGVGYYRIQKRKAELQIKVKSAEQLKSINQRLLSEVTERKKAEEKQTNLLEEVENINRELKDFASIVSHDLKAPLRGIKTLANWILSDEENKLGEQANEQMNLLLERIELMYSLIEGVLQYSKAGRAVEKRVQVNLNDFVPEIINMVVPPENISVTIEDELPVFECEDIHIMQIFQNLLSNAIKYMDKPQGRIKVGCVEQDGFWKFSVADNGPGIDEIHFEKIFKIFQALPTSSDFQGTGIGLTVTKKLVELYHGRIWIESKVGEGSTFFFTLPKQEIAASNEKLEAHIAC